MVCHQVVFARATCRIEIEPRPYALNGPSFVAFVYVLDGGDVVRPLTFQEGNRVEVHAKSESLTLNSAISLLQERFGAMTEPAHGCHDPAMPPRVAEPYVLSE